jgi:hypothetical protein
MASLSILSEAFIITKNMPQKAEYTLDLSLSLSLPPPPPITIHLPGSMGASYSNAYSDTFEVSTHSYMYWGGDMIVLRKNLFQ